MSSSNSNSSSGNANSSSVTTIEIKGWKLCRFTETVNEEPKIRDLDLAERLGYSRPRDIRKLITRLISEGKLSDVFRRATVARRGFAEEIIDEYWLTETQALKVAAKAETEPADVLLDEMIHVYQLARRGQLPGGISESRVTEIACAVAEQVCTRILKAFAEEKKNAPLNEQVHTIGKAKADEHILSRLRYYAKQKARSLDLDHNDTRVVSSIRAKAEQRIRKTIEFMNIGGASWLNLPENLLSVVTNELRSMIDEVHFDLKAKKKPLDPTEDLPIIRAGRECEKQRGALN